MTHRHRSTSVVRAVVMVALLGLTVSARAQDGPPPGADAAGVVDAAAAELEAARAEMEAVYIASADAHARLREWPPGTQEDGSPRLPAWLAGEPGSAALTILGAAARLDDATASDAAEKALAAVAPDDWKLHVGALALRLREQCRESVDVDVGALAAGLVQALLGESDFSMVWDTWFQAHPAVLRWRAAQAAGTADTTDPAAEAADDGTAGADGVAPNPAATEPQEPTPEAVVDVAETALISLEKGRFEIGPWAGWIVDLDDKKASGTRKLSFKALHVDRHEVTVAQYMRFLRESKPAARADLLPLGWSLNDEGAPVSPEGAADHPVTGISFLQASAYATAQGKRLPTEEEWERIAAAGAAERLYPWGATADDVAFGCKELADDAVAAVDAYPADVTPEGVLGLSGNVKELVLGSPEGKPVRGRLSPRDQVIVRGGGYRTRASECHVRWRWVIEVGAQEPDVGFRCVMDDAEFKRRR